MVFGAEFAYAETFGIGIEAGDIECIAYQARKGDMTGEVDILRLDLETVICFCCHNQSFDLFVDERSQPCGPR